MMRLFTTFVLLAAVFASAIAVTDYTNAKGYQGRLITPKYKVRVILTNDDSWASSNIRATYYALKTAGHNVLLASEAANQSGKGGTVVFPTTATLQADGRGGFVKKGAPYAGSEPTDKGITYLDGTPGAAVLYALDQVAPTFFGGKDPQIVLSGPNEGTNLGPFLYTLSGTIGASYISVERGIPAVAFSASTPVRDYPATNYNDANDPSIVLGTNIANLLAALTYVVPEGQPLAPLGIGSSVNFGKNYTDTICNGKRTLKRTRLTGGAFVDKVIISSNNLPTYANINTPALNVCLEGDCDLPGEQDAYNQDVCVSTISVYDIDYTAQTSSFTSANNQQINSAIDAYNKQNPAKRSIVAREN